MKVKVSILKRDLEPLHLACKAYAGQAVKEDIYRASHSYNLQCFALLLIKKAQQMQLQKRQAKSSMTVDINIVSTLYYFYQHTQLMTREELYMKTFLENANEKIIRSQN